MINIVMINIVMNDKYCDECKILVMINIVMNDMLVMINVGDAVEFVFVMNHVINPLY